MLEDEPRDFRAELTEKSSLLANLEPPADRI